MNDNPPPQPPPSPTVRKLIIEVVEARDLLPKDGLGSSSAYVVADFDGQKKRTSTVSRSLSPVWNETIEFVVADPKTMEYEELEIEVFNDKRMSNGSARKNHFLGRVKVYGSQFAKRGDEGLIYFPLEKKSVFSWIRGELGLKIYYYDELVVDDNEKKDEPPPPEKEVPPPEVRKSPVFVMEEGRVWEAPVPTEVVTEGPQHQQPPVITIEETPPVFNVQMEHHHQEGPPGPPPMMQPEYPPDMRRMQAGRGGGVERVRVMKRPNGEYSPRVIPGRFSGGETERMPAYDLVEPMQYLFIRIVKARGITQNESPYVKIRSSSHFVRSKPASYRPGADSANPEWHQVFALGHNKSESSSSTLEISVWDSPSENFIGGVCFDLSDVPVRDSPDSPLAPQWYRLEGGEDQNSGRVSGDIQLSVWIGTQADDAFPESWSSDAPYVVHTRSKVYQSPKLWYLRLTVMEAQDLHIAPNLPPLTAHPSPLNFFGI